MSNPPSWQDFEQRAPRPPSEEAIAWQDLNMRLFGSADGRAWLERMRKAKLDASTAPDIAESALRHLEGQRQVLRDIDRWVAQGLKRLSDKN